jgi:hypothetical protein
MPTSLVIVDDFLSDPDALRAHALGLEYPDLKGYFPGRNSLQRIEIPGMAQFASQMVGEPLVPVDPPQSHGKFRITLARDPRRGAVHVDASQWSAILYLTKPEDCRGGTEFFRHKATGLDRVPPTEVEARAAGFASVDDAVQKTISVDGNRRAAWEKTMDVPMRYNRLVFLRPWLFHTAGPGFGDSLENGRLIYLMFFSLAR